MTNDYRIMLPLMAAIVASVYVSHWLVTHSIYTLKLHRRGIAYPYLPENGLESDSPVPELKPGNQPIYRVEHERTLFGTDEERIVKATSETIGRYFTNRLRSVFPGVAEPGVLRNSANCPLYLLCFASGNEKGAPIALKIAEHLLREVR
jgi:hypothetical protein